MTINTEKAFDMLPHAADILEKLGLKDFILKNQTTDKKDIDRKGFDLVVFVLRNSGAVKENVFEIVAIMEDKTTEEVKKQSFVKTLASFKELIQDKELMSFFNMAM